MQNRPLLLFAKGMDYSLIKNSEDKLLIDRIMDLYSQCDRYGMPVFGNFLDRGSLTLIEDNVYPEEGTKKLVYGGYEGAERCIYGVFPEWSELCESEFPISCISI